MDLLDIQYRFLSTSHPTTIAIMPFRPPFPCRVQSQLRRRGAASSDARVSRCAIAISIWLNVLFAIVIYIRMSYLFMLANTMCYIIDGLYSTSCLIYPRVSSYPLLSGNVTKPQIGTA
jgi:hypothetical protein